ncbi:MAG: hypothetical protein U5N86_01340 [Planctomycetota bacterium]|nr:hypothetical protein [Planctomycetota bacterium]
MNTVDRRSKPRSQRDYLPAGRFENEPQEARVFYTYFIVHDKRPLSDNALFGPARLLNPVRGELLRHRTL